MDDPPAKRQRPGAPALEVVVLNQAARIAPALQERLGSTWRVRTVSLEEASAEAACSAAVAVVSPPLNGVNDLLSKMPGLRLLQSMSAGIEYINLDACPGSVTVCNTSTMDHAIAEHVIGTMLMFQARFAEEDRRFRSAIHAEQSFVPPFRFAGCSLGPAAFHGELGGKTLGMIGFGHIGTEIAKRARAFNMRVHAVAHRPRDAMPDVLDWYGTVEELKAMVKQCHFVVVCCSLNASSKKVVSADVLACMRKDAVLINVARGPVVDEDALFQVLQLKKIRGAILDVWWKYPSKEEPVVLPSKHPYHELDNVIMTPHTSGWTSEQEERKVEQVAYNIGQASQDQPAFRFVCKQATAGVIAN